jgi:glycine/D-amino acid oxidase-like deaminating enzyme
MPVLLVATGLNKWGAGPSPAMADLLAGKIPGSVLRIIPEHGPLTLIEDPDKFLALIDDFYDAVPRRGQ